MDIANKIEQKLGKQLDLHHFELKDFTGRHLSHKQHDGGFHLEAVIVSDTFINKTLIDEIHAFSMKTLTQKEWKKK